MIPLRDLREPEPSRRGPRLLALVIVEQVTAWLLLFGVAAFHHDRHDHIQPVWLKWVLASLSIGLILGALAAWLLLILVTEAYKLWTGDYPKRFR